MRQHEVQAEAVESALGRALEITRAAYEEAMLRHGLLPSTVALISTYAEETLALLRSGDELELPPARWDDRGR